MLRVPRRIFARGDLELSRAIPSSCGAAPASSTWACNRVTVAVADRLVPALLDSQQLVSRSDDGNARLSDTSTEDLPEPASKPTSARPIRRPGLQERDLPCAIQRQAGEVLHSREPDLQIRTDTCESLSVFSTMTTALAPEGSGAPVMISQHWPFWT